MFSFLAFAHSTRNMGESVHMCECSCLFVSMHMPTHVPARALMAAAVCVYVRVCVCVLGGGQRVCGVLGGGV